MEASERSEQPSTLASDDYAAILNGISVLQVTISAGATILRSDEQRLDSLTRADEAMYRSKTEGRDRVTVV